eukprot:TRINITY_DN5881_c0_g1_i1.p1 TRINITY_DN5881_c0_g1~~TRINITY_DN5881_c0_g1_i1.p1  ORF type:complete len:377 (+),score=60.48 TRINITY_DN5881_c0_g1_i1:149-1279(+)
MAETDEAGLWDRLFACLREPRALHSNLVASDEPSAGGQDGAQLEVAQRWAAVFEDLRGKRAFMMHAANSGAAAAEWPESLGCRRALLAFLNEIPSICPDVGGDVEELLSWLFRESGVWLAAARDLRAEVIPALDANSADERVVQNGCDGMLSIPLQGPVFERLRVEETALAQKVEAMLSRVLGGHPDADVLVPLAILEVATDDEHRAALEARVDDPRRFRDYAFAMVCVVPPLGDSFVDDSCAQGDGTPMRPCSPEQRSRIVNQLTMRLDESFELEQLDESCSRAANLNASGHLDLETSNLFADICSPGHGATSSGGGAGAGNGRVIPRVEVRKAYLQLAKQYHPDKGGDQDMFVALNDAYELLRADSHESGTLAC